MRLLIDMQGAQTTGSRNRGIGRYTQSLVTSLIREGGNHEVMILLNLAFPESIACIMRECGNLLPARSYRFFNPARSSIELPVNTPFLRQANELIYLEYVRSIKPDVLLITSLFEGLSDNFCVAISSADVCCPVAVVLYDLIPYVYQDIYLSDPAVRSWYFERLDYLMKAEKLLAISEWSRQELINTLGCTEDKCINISSDVDPIFRKITVSKSILDAQKSKYGISGNFLMYTGGIDFRKNIEGLITSYAALDSVITAQYQLAIVCRVDSAAKVRLEGLCQEFDIPSGRVVFTGYVPDEDLVALYNAATLFIFPSLHEGFGLPALEAMRCGAPVIASNASSLPEVIGLPDALFDPRSTRSIATLIERTIKDIEFRKKLIENSNVRSKLFSWKNTARAAWRAFEEMRSDIQFEHGLARSSNTKLKLAYVSPYPPEKSGIAGFSEQILPSLSKYYDIKVVCNVPQMVRANNVSEYELKSVDWFFDNADGFDRIIYHFGNSAFHKHMFEMLDVYPGVVVLHDFFLSGVLRHVQANDDSSNCWMRALYISHGYRALNDLVNSEDADNVMWQYPCNLEVIQSALGVIVHSEYAANLIKNFYGTRASHAAMVPLVRGMRSNVSKQAARRRLGFNDRDVLVCSFGLVNETKLNHRVADAWIELGLHVTPFHKLVFVGENDQGHYGDMILDLCSNSMGTISISGWVSAEVYNDYLAAADVGIQLRVRSRGETSAAVLDCMSYGLATIINANGSMAEIDPDAVIMIPDDFSDQELYQALQRVIDIESYRKNVGAHAAAYVADRHSAEAGAQRYRDLIEKFYSDVAFDLDAVCDKISRLEGFEEGGHVNMAVAAALDSNMSSCLSPPEILIDISVFLLYEISQVEPELYRGLLRDILLSSLPGYRLEFIRLDPACGYCYARQFSYDLLDITDGPMPDAPVEFKDGDSLMILAGTFPVPYLRYEVPLRLRNIGVKIWYIFASIFFVAPDLHKIRFSELQKKSDLADFFSFATGIITFDDLCLDSDVDDWFSDASEGVTSIRRHSLDLSGSKNPVDRLSAVLVSSLELIVAQEA